MGDSEHFLRRWECPRMVSRVVRAVAPRWQGRIYGGTHRRASHPTNSHSSPSQAGPEFVKSFYSVQAKSGVDLLASSRWVVCDALAVRVDLGLSSLVLLSMRCVKQNVNGEI